MFIHTLAPKMPLSSKEKSQRWRDRKKADATEHAKYLESERRRYQNRIKSGTRKLIGDLSERSKRIRRKVWRSPQKNSRQRETCNDDNSNAVATSPGTSTPALLSCTSNSISGSNIASASIRSINSATNTPLGELSDISITRRLRGRRQVRKDRSKAYKTIESLKKKLSNQT